MSETEKDPQSKPATTHSTNFSGNITGPVHFGQGDIKVKTFNATSHTAITSKDDLISSLRSLQLELEQAHTLGLPENTLDEMVIQVSAAEREAKKTAPQPKRIVERLDNAKALLTAGTGLAVVSATAIDKFIPLIEEIARSVGKVFNLS